MLRSAGGMHSQGCGMAPAEMGPCNPHWQSALGKEEPARAEGNKRMKQQPCFWILAFIFEGEVLILKVLSSSPRLAAALWNQKCNTAWVHGVRAHPAKEGLGGTLCSCTHTDTTGRAHPHHPNLTREQELTPAIFSLIGWVSLHTTAYTLLCCRSEG